MKSIRRMTQLEFGALVQSHLRHEGIQVVLSGGAAVSLYNNNKYLSRDLDLINVNFAKRGLIRRAMEAMGFSEKGRYFTHPETEQFIEFPDGPLSVGEEPVREIVEIKFETGTLRVISATDCIKDRLCAYYFWGDQQGLAQAVLVARNNKIDMKEVERWSKAEGKPAEYDIFEKRTRSNSQVDDLNSPVKTPIKGRATHVLIVSAAQHDHLLTSDNKTIALIVCRGLYAGLFEAGIFITSDSRALC